MENLAVRRNCTNAAQRKGRFKPSYRTICFSAMGIGSNLRKRHPFCPTLLLLLMVTNQASKDCVQKTLKRLEEKMHGRVSKCVGFLGVQIKIPVASFVERGVQTFILLELHWF